MIMENNVEGAWVLIVEHDRGAWVLIVSPDDLMVGQWL